MEKHNLNSKATEILAKNGTLIKLTALILMIFASVFAIMYLIDYYHNLQIIKEFAGMDMEVYCNKNVINFTVMNFTPELLS